MSDSDSDGPPEEYTQEQAKLEDAALRKIQRESIARAAREKKERRKRLAEKLTPRKSRKVETFEDVEEQEPEEQEQPEEEDSESLAKKGFLSQNIIDFLAKGQKKKFASDSEEEEVKEEIPRKKKEKSSGIETVIYREIPPPACTEGASDFLKKRKAQVPRSSSVLKKSGQAVTGAALANKRLQRK
ncbi:unnamed protein product [Arabis nemorensis]|uniref:Uncharacterized protein n=1 Tax=Arabis nemorensis TaxID=586526 RepID=A0A565C8J4_9BRAS|nr:unnamed protein product [Arabis nemorensis]